MREMKRRILVGSLRRCKSRAVVSVLAIALGASLIVAAVNLRGSIRGKLAEELRNYGANLLLVPETGPFLRETDLLILEDKRVKDRLIGYVPFLHRVASIRGKDTVIAGTGLVAIKKLSPWWQVDGRWPQGKNEALAGFNVASKLGLRVGDSVTVSQAKSRLTFSIAGIVRTGGAEEHQLFVDLEKLQLLTGLPGLLSSVLVSSRAENGLDQTVAFLQREWRGAEVRTLLQVARAEESVLSRLQLFLTLIGLLVLFASGLSVFATMATAALERKVEMALMRALGAEKKEIAWIFASEAAAIGGIGGLLGSVLGLIFAQVIGLSVFRALVLPSAMSLPTGIAIGLGIALLSSLSVVRKSATIAPAVILKGE